MAEYLYIAVHYGKIPNISIISCFILSHVKIHATYEFVSEYLIYCIGLWENTQYFNKILFHTVTCKQNRYYKKGSYFGWLNIYIIFIYILLCIIRLYSTLEVHVTSLTISFFILSRVKNI